MSRLPIRARLTLVFAGAMAVLLAALGIFVYVRIGATLTGTIDSALRGQLTESTGRLEEGATLLDQDAQAGSTVGELLRADGSVVRSTPEGLRPFLNSADLQAVAAGRTLLRSRHLPGLSNDWRILAQRVGETSQVLVVGRSLETREETLHRLLREFLIAAPLALLLASLGGYGLAAAALRPVETMRRRAAAVSATAPGQRLPVPETGDEISRLAHTLNEMLDRLETALAHERRFVADASHELRTPLTLLRTELELALRRTRTREELETAIPSAVAEATRLSRLADDLLLLARADQDGIPLRLREVEAQALLEHTRERFAARAAELGRDLRVVPGPVRELEADPERVEQALGNLVENALKHGAGAIELSSRAGTHAVELHLRDEGPGIAAPFLARAFDRFSQADESRGGSGSGLGLAIVHSIALAHGGSAGAANLAEGGLDIWISLPD